LSENHHGNIVSFEVSSRPQAGVLKGDLTNCHIEKNPNTIEIFCFAQNSSKLIGL